ncbi:MAG: hypothetical protein IT330_01100 [Anaerolineae bacterium]|nr:hypothetical protein [Anaerolineae bacterium]
MLRASLTLLDMMIKEHPDATDLALAYQQKAECLLALDDETGAIVYFREALQAEKKRPNVITSAALRFSWMVVERGLTPLYDEALAGLQDYIERSRVMVFAYEHYILNAVRAVITEERGYHDLARKLAQLALDAAALEHSGFRYHPKVGLVHSKDDPVYARLKQIASA